MPAWNRLKFHIGISSHSLASQRLGLQGRANRNLCSPFLNEARRFYYVYNVHHQQCKPRRLRRWFLVGLLIYSGVCAKIYYDHLESVPYHKRTRLILTSESQLRSSGERYFKREKESFGDRILPDTHPESIRVRRIAQDIIDAYEVEIQREGSQLSTTRSHSDGLKWEVLVVSGSGDAFYLPYGKIVMFDWMLEHLTSDAEIAFLLGHEIGHIVARHYDENLTMACCFRIMGSVLNPIGLWDVFMNKYAVLVMRIFWKQEFEADYIGMCLSASAGYDPREAPKSLEKMDKLWTPNITHPTPKMRAKYLSFPHVMEEPLSIYLRGCIK